MIFKNPEYLFLLLILIPVIAGYLLRINKSDASLQISSTRYFAGFPKTRRLYLRHLPFVLRMLTIIMLILVIARPQISDSVTNTSTEGIDIMMAIDISGTMLAKDLKPNRIDAAKNVAVEFINNRPNDNIGLVIFASESFTQCPLTTNHAALINLFQSVEFGMVDDGTAIGMGLATAVNRLKNSKAKSKVIILLTDGSNNTGDIAPLTAAEIARTYGIRVYTIGVGTRGVAPMPVPTPFGIQYQNMPVEFDENTLSQIAQMTNGKYYRATDNNTLQSIYHDIDKLEKRKLQVKEYNRRSDEFGIFALLALLFLGTELALRYTLLRKLPE
jgi:Ca-activated chloride channel family protein